MKSYLAALATGLFSAAASGQALPSGVVASIKAAPEQDSVTLAQGQVYHAPAIMKVRNLTITPGSELVFPLQTSYAAEYYVLSVRNLFIQVATPMEPSPLLTYTRNGHYKRITDCYPPAVTGGRGDLNHPNGYDGGAAPPAGNAAVRSPVKVYVILANVSVSGGAPVAARLMIADFNGNDGDDGADGCNGGRGGDGVDASGFEDAGDSGKPGAGGKGGDAAAGQAGATFGWYVPRSLQSTVPFFIVSVEGGRPGIPGEGGPCGQTGTAGSGSAFKKGGRGIGCDAPPIGPAGAKASNGARGAVTTNFGDYSDVLPSLTANRRSINKGRSTGAQSH